MLEDIKELLKGTFLEDAMMMELEIPRTTNIAIAIDVKSENAIKAWKLLRSYSDQTQRYPVLTTSWSIFAGTWEQGMIDADLFDRSEFDEDYPEKLSPEEIIKKGEAFSQEKLKNFLSSEDEFGMFSNLEDEIIYQLDKTKDNYGDAPSTSEIKTANIKTPLALESYLLNWEMQQNQQSPLYLWHQDWFEPGDIELILLPNPHSWNALAYLSFFGGCHDLCIYVLRQWYQDYGAELVCHYGTMLQLFVERPPTDLQVAFDLAWEQVNFAPCTTRGVSIRSHARALLQLDRWFLHNRP